MDFTSTGRSGPRKLLQLSAFREQSPTRRWWREGEGGTWQRGWDAPGRFEISRKAWSLSRRAMRKGGMAPVRRVPETGETT